MRLKAITACLLWASAFAGAKIGFQYVGPIFLSGLRFMFAGLLLVPIIYFKKEDFRGAFKHWRFMLFFAFIQTFLHYGLFFMGLDKVPGATASIIIGAGPLFVAILAHLTLKNDKMSLRKALAITLGFAGIIFISISKGEISNDNPHFYVGVGLLVISNIIGSFTNIMVAKKKSANLSPIVLASFSNFVGGVGLFITSIFVEKPTFEFYPFEFYVALLWLSFISAAGFSIWYTLIHRPDVKVSELNMWKFIIPIAGSIFSWWLVKGENPDFITILGMIIISIALLLQQAPDSFFVKFKRVIRGR